MILALPEEGKTFSFGLDASREGVPVNDAKRVCGFAPSLFHLSHQ